MFLKAVGRLILCLSPECKISKDPNLEGLGDGLTNLHSIFYIETGRRGRHLALNSGKVSLISEQGHELPIAAGDQALNDILRFLLFNRGSEKAANVIKRRYKPIIFFEHLGSVWNDSETALSLALLSELQEQLVIFSSAHRSTQFQSQLVGHIGQNTLSCKKLKDQNKVIFIIRRALY